MKPRTLSHIMLIISFVQNCFSFTPYAEMNHDTAFHTTHGPLSVTAQVFKQNECKRHFGCNLIAKGYCPVQIHIHNNSGSPYIIDTQYIRYPSSTEVIPLISSSVIINAISYRLALFMLLTIPVATKIFWQAIPYVIAPLGIVTYAYNKNVRDGLQQAVLEQEQVIKPFSSITFLIFIPETLFYGLFDLCVFDPEERTLLTIPIDVAGNAVHVPGVYVS